MMSLRQTWGALVIAVFLFVAAPGLAEKTRHPSQMNDSFTLDYSVFPLEQKAGTAELFPMPLCNGFKLEEATVDQMQAAMERGQITSQQLVICYLQRMYQTESYIKCVLQPVSR